MDCTKCGTPYGESYDHDGCHLWVCEVCHTYVRDEE